MSVVVTGTLQGVTTVMRLSNGVVRTSPEGRLALEGVQPGTSHIPALPVFQGDLKDPGQFITAAMTVLDKAQVKGYDWPAAVEGDLV